MTRKYFGTDGVRGTVGEAPMTPDFVMRLGYAAGQVLAGQSAAPAVVIGKDTRISGYMIESALEAGFSAAGVDVHMCGPVTDRKSTRLNSSHLGISYAVFCLKKKKKKQISKHTT